MTPSCSVRRLAIVILDLIGAVTISFAQGVGAPADPAGVEQIADTCARAPLAAWLNRLDRGDPMGAIVFVGTTDNCVGCNAAVVNMIVSDLRAQGVRFAPAMLLGVSARGEGRSLRRLFRGLPVFEAPLDSVLTALGHSGPGMDLYVLDSRLDVLYIAKNFKRHPIDPARVLHLLKFAAGQRSLARQVKIAEAEDELLIGPSTPIVKAGQLALVDEQRNEFVAYDLATGERQWSWQPDSIADYWFRPAGDDLWPELSSSLGTFTLLQGVARFDSAGARLFAHIKTRIIKTWDAGRNDSVIVVFPGYGLVDVTRDGLRRIDSFPALVDGGLDAPGALDTLGGWFPVFPFTRKTRSVGVPYVACLISRETGRIALELPDTLAARLAGRDTLKPTRPQFVRTSDSTVAVCDPVNRLLFLGAQRGSDTISWGATAFKGLAMRAAIRGACQPERTGYSLLGIDGGNGRLRVAIALRLEHGMSILLQTYLANGDLVDEFLYEDARLSRPRDVLLCRTGCTSYRLLAKTPQDRWVVIDLDAAPA